MVTQTRSLLMSSRLVKIFLVVSLVAMTRSVAADDSIDAFLEEVKELVSRETEFTSETDAKEWLARTNVALAEQNNKAATASFNYATNITNENRQKQVAAALAMNRWSNAHVIQAKKYLSNSNNFAPGSDVIRQLKIFVQGEPFVSKDAALSRKLEETSSKLQVVYTDAHLTKNGKTYYIEPELTEIMSTSRDYDELLWAWLGWRDAIGPRAKPLFTEVVTMLNLVSRQNGFSDAGEAWRVSNYEFDNIESTTHDLYEEVRPLYEQLHAYVRRKLIQKYPGRGIDPSGGIPAHLLGNMWGQQWDSIMDVVTPYPLVAADNVTGPLQSYTAKRMFKMAEDFFKSIGLDPMTSTFWNKSMIEKPRDRHVDCHGSATDFFKEGDYRIKMCSVRTGESLNTIHHEMGHIQYFMQYHRQPSIYRTGANAAFHEAVGDTITLSVKTPGHLRAMGLLKTEKPKGDSGSENDEYKKDINFLMKIALEKIAFLPFGYMIDRWRWEVFRGQVTPENYNRRWWELRRLYQGLIPPARRTQNDFDPAAKFHVSYFIPYIRYFFSFIGQFQFHEALCKAAGHTGPLQKCDIYRSKKAGDLLKSLLSLGGSKPWPESMEVITGQRKFKTDAILEYFKPLHDWLKRANAQEHVGWKNHH
ncbi:hypothetical protein NP493_1078g02064 [Ridgeia piscesae]|uniref:Angiotensin-converting enzyme n=1 Tax=Ridgeia piscesae TaxID=27915 RepID=A0AAD9KHQ5_RIDPI|nr:hypothetical protein NP493_1078g02064 [Ridgeia piscesae]